MGTCEGENRFVGNKLSMISMPAVYFNCYAKTCITFMRSQKRIFKMLLLNLDQFGDCVIILHRQLFFCLSFLVYYA